jgi:serine phosphatase RsbU (regulator of sigma subunit)
VLLYTDGVIEARSATGEQFSSGGLRQALDGGHETAQKMVDAVMRAVGRFRGERELLDDLTLVAVQLQPRLDARAVRTARWRRPCSG